MIPLTKLTTDSLDFPPVEHALADPNGLLAIGGDLRTERLIQAYQQGIFPWFNTGDPVLWWSPDPRAVLLPAELHLSHSMRKFLRHIPYRITINSAFPAIIHACAKVRHEETWITNEIENAYISLYHYGIAHSVEVWQDNILVGGLYGVAQGSLFCGESMFNQRSNASKCALYAFCQHFVDYGGKLIDCQVLNHHTASLGAREIERAHFLQYLAKLQQDQLDPACWQPQVLLA